MPASTSVPDAPPPGGAGGFGVGGGAVDGFGWVGWVGLAGWAEVALGFGGVALAVVAAADNAVALDGAALDAAALDAAALDAATLGAAVLAADASTAGGVWVCVVAALGCFEWWLQAAVKRASPTTAASGPGLTVALGVRLILHLRPGEPDTAAIEVARSRGSDDAQRD